MDALMNKIRNTYDFTEYELKIIRYIITALLYDLSIVPKSVAGDMLRIRITRT